MAYMQEKLLVIRHVLSKKLKLARFSIVFWRVKKEEKNGAPSNEFSIEIGKEKITLSFPAGVSGKVSLEFCSPKVDELLESLPPVKKSCWLRPLHE